MMFARLSKLQFFKAVESCTGGYGRFRCQRVNINFVGSTMLERVASMLETMFDRNQNILLTKNVSQTSSNMPATRSNIVRPTNAV